MRYENHSSEFGSLQLYDVVNLLRNNERYGILSLPGDMMNCLRCRVSASGNL